MQVLAPKWTSRHKLLASLPAWLHSPLALPRQATALSKQTARDLPRSGVQGWLSTLRFESLRYFSGRYIFPNMFRLTCYCQPTFDVVVLSFFYSLSFFAFFSRSLFIHLHSRTHTSRAWQRLFMFGCTLCTALLDFKGFVLFVSVSLHTFSPQSTNCSADGLLIFSFVRFLVIACLNYT